MDSLKRLSNDGRNRIDTRKIYYRADFYPRHGIQRIVIAT